MGSVAWCGNGSSVRLYGFGSTTPSDGKSEQIEEVRRVKEREGVGEKVLGRMRPGMGISRLPRRRRAYHTKFKPVAPETSSIMEVVCTSKGSISSRPSPPSLKGSGSVSVSLPLGRAGKWLRIRPRS